MSEFKEAFDSFMDEDFEDQCLSTTESGSELSVELFADGSYRVIGPVGNLYDSEGLIIGIPELREDDMEDDDEPGSFNYFGNAEEKIREWFGNALMLRDEYAADKAQRLLEDA